MQLQLEWFLIWRYSSWCQFSVSASHHIWGPGRKHWWCLSPTVNYSSWVFSTALVSCNFSALFFSFVTQVTSLGNTEKVSIISKSRLTKGTRMLLCPHYTLSRCLGAGVTSAPLGNLCTTNLWLVTRRAAPHRPGHVTGRRPRRLVLLWPGPLYVRTSYLGRWTRPGVRPEPGVSAPLSQVVGFTHANVQVRDCYLPSPRAGRCSLLAKPETSLSLGE